MEKYATPLFAYHVYLIGLKGPSRRSLLYDPGMVQVGIPAGAKGAIGAPFMN